ncbi:S66 family peptidase [Companilactobacillus kimchiensis]|uniref:Microcin C7 immunity protein n=1 Tax=Companilactobacillus kimchiensis TaxID=993692 RepID=A0A0R2L6C3_9LACO|nr:S66 peptidase family protein [Companilactobacillus kimchiensis]KRN97368.1 microcin C7 immunity protein [Companilactobacillus kimchiensis]
MKIGFFSSSTPITKISPKRFIRAKQFLETKGIELVAGKLTGQSDFYRAGSIKERADEINQLIHDNSIDILMATIGGSNTNAILEYLDFDYLQAHPKIIVGYSDITAFLLAVKTKAPACRVLYGPALVASFGEFSPIVDVTWEDFEQVILATSTVTVAAPEEWTDEQVNWENFEHDKQMFQNKWHYTDTPILTGRIIGGNLNTMSGIIGSKYFPEFTKDDLLLIEDAEKDASIIEKNFAMIKNAGVFDQVKGIILGKHALFDDLGTGRRPIDILLEVLGDKKLPIIYDYDSSHTVPMLTTPLGAQVRIDAEKMQISFSEF